MLKLLVYLVYIITYILLITCELSTELLRSFMLITWSKKYYLFGTFALIILVAYLHYT